MNYELIKPESQAERDFHNFEMSLLEMQMSDVSETIMALQYKAMDLYQKGEIDSPELNDLLLRVKKAEERYRELKNSHSDTMEKEINEREMDRLVIEKAKTTFRLN